MTIILPNRDHPSGIVDTADRPFCAFGSDWGMLLEWKQPLEDKKVQTNSDHAETPIYPDFLVGWVSYFTTRISLYRGIFLTICFWSIWNPIDFTVAPLYRNKDNCIWLIVFEHHTFWIREIKLLLSIKNLKRFFLEVTIQSKCCFSTFIEGAVSNLLTLYLKNSYLSFKSGKSKPLCLCSAWKTKCWNAIWTLKSGLDLFE